MPMSFVVGSFIARRVAPPQFLWLCSLDAADMLIKNRFETWPQHQINTIKKRILENKSVNSGLLASNQEGTY
jgi:hypothetical protein